MGPTKKYTPSGPAEPDPGPGDADPQSSDTPLDAGQPGPAMSTRQPGGEAPPEEADAATLTATLLRDLFTDQTTILVSNAAVRALIDGLLSRYQKQPDRRQRTAVLLHWTRDVPRLRKALREEAAADPVVLDGGQEVPLMNEEKATSLLDRYCPGDPYLPNPPRAGGNRSVR
jgi:hypothetical protein